MSNLINILGAIFSSKRRAVLGADESKIDRAMYLLVTAERHFHHGEFARAVETCMHILSLQALDGTAEARTLEIEFEACLKAAQKRFPGPDYLAWLRWFHERLKPATYLEIGVESGQSLHFAQAPTRAVGVDPAIQIVHSQETWVKLFRLESDVFFATQDLRKVMGANTVDFAFIDGLHTFDQALKDFIHIERYASHNTVVLFHDIFPVIPETALRERRTRFWVGDTWKVIQILKTHRPDLNVFTIPAYPSGLGVVTNLDASSLTLMKEFDQICLQAQTYDLATWVGNGLRIVENDFDSVARLLGLTPPPS